MKSLKWYVSNTWSKWSLTTKIFFLLAILSLILWGISESRAVSYNETRELMIESAKISAQMNIDADLNEILYDKTSYNLSEIRVIAKEFKLKAKNDYDKAFVFYNLGEYHSAIYHFNQSLSEYNGDQEFFIGVSYLYLNKTTLAREWLNKCTKNLEFPLNWQCQSNLAYSYILENDFENAIINYNKAISVFPNNFDYFAIGTTYMKIKSNESHIEAIKYFNLILSSDKNWTKGDIYNYKPSKNSILLNKGVALMRLNKLNESIEIFLQLLEDGRSDTTIYHNLAINYYKLGNYDNSLYYVTKSLEINPSNDESLMLLQEILIKQ